MISYVLHKSETCQLEGRAQNVTTAYCKDERTSACPMCGHRVRPHKHTQQTNLTTHVHQKQIQIEIETHTLILVCAVCMYRYIVYIDFLLIYIVYLYAQQYTFIYICAERISYNQGLHIYP